MRILRKLLRLSTSKTQNTTLLEPASLSAFGHLTSSQQSMVAEALVASADERRRLDKAS